MEKGIALFPAEPSSALPLTFRFAELSEGSGNQLSGRATEYWSDAGQNMDED